jgi:hypothetical protein
MEGGTMRLRTRFFACLAAAGVGVLGVPLSGLSPAVAQTAPDAKGQPAPAAPAPADNCRLKASAHKSAHDEWTSCISVDASLSTAPAIGDTATLRVHVSAAVDRQNASVAIDLPDNLQFVDAPAGASVAAVRSVDGVSSVQRASRRADLSARAGRDFSAKVKAVKAGFGQIRARVTADAGNGRVDAGSDDVFLTVGAAGAASRFGGPAQSTNGATVAQRASAGRAVAQADPPGRAHEMLRSGLAVPSSDDPDQGRRIAVPGQSCASVGWFYQDQDGVTRPSVNTVVEAWDDDTFSGDDLLASGFIDYGGHLTLCFNNDDGDPFSGGTQEVYLLLHENNVYWKVQYTGTTNELYFTTGSAVSIADNTTYNFGDLFPGDPALDRGLHAYDAANGMYNWMYTGGCAWDPNDGSCRQLVINWSPSSVDGTYWNGEVHLAADDPNSEITVDHEMSHNLMYDLYDGYFPPAPSCNPHSIFGVSSQGCAWTEGFAEWAPASIENDPNFRWPNGAVQPLETPTWGYATPGDSLEGWIAGALIDIADTNNEPYWDRYSEGGGLPDRGNIFAQMANDSIARANTLVDFWNLRGSLGYNVANTGAAGSIYQSTIDYGFRDPLTNTVEVIRPTPTPHNYSFVTTIPYWTVFGARTTGADYDVSVYDDYAQFVNLGSSTYGSSTIDFVAIDGNRRAAGDYYPRVYQFSGTGNYTAEYHEGSTILDAGSAFITMNTNDVVTTRDSFQTAGVPVYVRVVPSNGTQDAELFLMGDDPAVSSTWVRGRSSAVASATVTGAGQAESLVYTPAFTEYYGLVVVNKAGSGTYTVYVDQSAPTGSVSINGGAAATNSLNVTLSLSATDAQTGVTSMQVSTDGVFDSEPVEAYATSKAISFTGGAGTKTAYVRFMNGAGQWSSAFSDSISVLPDYTVTSVSNPPATVVRGQAVSITDTTHNNSAVASVSSSKTRYYLSLDTVKSGNDPQLAGDRSMGPLAANGDSTGTVTPTITAKTKPGTYYLLACADVKNQVVEVDENNNCKASATTVVVQVPDLKVSAASNPPATGHVGTSWSETDTTKNSGNGTAAASTTRYYLSLDLSLGAGDIAVGSRAIPLLAAGAQSAGSATATIPGGTAAGTYHLLVCSDDAHVISESNENNNCRAAANTIVVS